MTLREKLLAKFVGVIILALFVGLISYPQALSKVPPIYNALNKLRINLGLDLQGGIHLEYQADTSQIESSKVDEAVQAVQDVIERRVNAFGVAEPVVYTTKTGSNRRLIVELAGVKDINQAKDMIKETPFLEFKEEGDSEEMVTEVHSAHILIMRAQANESDVQSEIDKQNEEKKILAQDVLKKALAGEDFGELAKTYSDDPGTREDGGDLDFVSKGKFVPEFDEILFGGKLKDGEVNPQVVETQFGWHILKKIGQREQPKMEYVSTGLTGKNLKNATVTFSGQGMAEPQVSLQFDDDGTKLFADLTKKNLHKTIAIYLDGKMLTNPTVQAEITNGEAVITGRYTIDDAKNLVRRLNEGALPVPISLVSQQSVEASLGAISLEKSLKAGLVGLVLVMIFMIFYYRFLGVIASLALLIYSGLMISIFKLSAFSPWQITLTLPGIAGFVLSIGMAVDANILIFERTKEEIRRGRSILNALDEGFKRAWTSIRDGNVSSIITSLILIEMGTGFVKGFAVTLILGVLVSLFTAITVSRTLLNFLLGDWIEDKLWLIGVKDSEVDK